MPQTEAEKRAQKKWRESNKEYFNEYYHANKEKLLQKVKINRLKKTIAKKNELLDLYLASRAPDSPITTDEDSN
jgi:ribosomal protein L29